MIFFRLFPSITRKSSAFYSSSLMIISVFVLLVAYFPCISSSPLTKINSNDKIFDPREDSTLLPPSVPDHRSFSSEQARAHANQFLMSHVNENHVIVPKQFTRFNDDDDDDYDLINKRSSIYNSGGYSHLKKRKQMAKPPMEVMNEIVNSIYLKRR